MKALYITSAATFVGIALFGLLMSSIPAPLGGEPFSVVTLSDRQRAEDHLAKSIAAARMEKHRASKPKVTGEQKDPVYFNKADAPKPEDFKAPLEKIDPETVSHASKAKGLANQLELIAETGLPPAPDPELVEKSTYGDLPRISDEGKRAQDVYARPSSIHHRKNSNTKTIAILLTGLGLSQPITENALEKLPPEITLAFNPYSAGLKKWAARSRRTGHEMLVEVPMEPFDFPDNDPGPHTLLSQQSDKANIERLRWIMARMTGYVGIVNVEGGRFTTSEDALHPILRELKNRGLFYMDSNPQSGDIPYQLAQEMNLDYLQTNLNIDVIKSAAAIDKSLAQLEKIANQHGTAIGIASALPLSVQRITEWSANLKKRGITLVPLSATTPKKQS